MNIFEQCFKCPRCTVCVLALIFQCNDILLSPDVPQYNRVWIPDAEHVWKSAEITRDFHSGDDVLELLFEDGTVSTKVTAFFFLRVTGMDLEVKISS